MSEPLYKKPLLPTTLIHPVPSTSFYSSVSVYQQIDRQGSSQGFDLFGKSVTRDSVESQTNFIRKVFALTSIQFLFMTCFSITFVYYPHWYQQSYKTLILLLPTVLLLAVLAWQLWTQHHRLSHHIRYILIFVYSSLMTFTLSSVATQFFEEYAIMVLTMSSLGILSNVVYTFQKRFLFQGPKPIVCSSAIICITSLGLRSIYQLDPVEILGPIAISSLICVYVDLEIYYAMYTMTEDEYILANLSFYIDLVYPINALHHACELSDDMDDFPEFFNPDSSSALNHI
ncbi:BI1-like protein [Choanephora cucurbitarum]|uniref:BI1-like protein n=1 Tax=Choanephora cucurbitarum TaxID=101091 RepID=A0A1C7NRH0_9FUNG|nr:BI1-like protein [Choanephora cucurbitarum]